MFDIRENRQYKSQLRHTVDNLFLLASVEGYTIESLAKASRLSAQTLYNLRSGLTRLPRYSTVYQLAHCLDALEYFCGQGNEVAAKAIQANEKKVAQASKRATAPKRKVTKHG